MQKYYLHISGDGDVTSHPIAHDNLVMIYGDQEDHFYLANKYMLIGYEEPVVEDNQRFEVAGYSVKEDGSYSWDFNIITLDQDHLSNLHIRLHRDVLLKDCDWSVLPDNALSAEEIEEWKTYRQALRDLPSVYPTVQKPEDVTWPIPPNAPVEAAIPVVDEGE